MAERDRLRWISLVDVPLLVLDDVRIVDSNEAAGALLGFADHGAGVSVETVFAGSDPEILRQAFSLSPEPRWTSLRCSLDGTWTTLRIKVRELPDTSWRLVQVGSDIPQWHAGSGAAWETREPELVRLLPRIFDLLPIGIHVEDSSLKSVFVNDSFNRLFGYTIDEIEMPEQWWPLVYPDATYREAVQDQWFAAVEQARSNNSEIIPQEFRVTCKDQSEKIIQFHCRGIQDYHVHAYVDVSAERHLAAELRRWAHTDELTGVANRRSFFEAAKRAVAADLVVAVILFDLDHFKIVNDRFGHAMGDHALTVVAGRCSQVLESKDMLARLGGEEFAVLLPGCDRATAERVAERLRAATAHSPVGDGENAITLTISVGCACREGADDDIDTLLLRADQGLYRAKREGRNRVEFQAGPTQGDRAATTLRGASREDPAMPTGS